jgi:hypothetical protein
MIEMLETIIPKPFRVLSELCPKEKRLQKTSSSASLKCGNILPVLKCKTICSFYPTTKLNILEVKSNDKQVPEIILVFS